MTESERKYEGYKEFLLNELMYIDSMFDLHIYLKNQHVDRVDVLNISSAFFGLTENALLECATIRLCRLYDSDTKTITIKKFICFVEQNVRSIFQDKYHKEIAKKVQEDRIELEKYKDKIEILKRIRDTSLAHNDICKLQDKYDMWDGSGIVIGDIHTLIQYGADVINHYTHYSEDTCHSIKAVNKLDVQSTLNILENSDYIQKNRK